MKSVPLFFLLLFGSLNAQDVPKITEKAKSTFYFPQGTQKKEKKVVETVVTDSAVRLTKNAICLAADDIPFFVTTSPKGMIETVPVKNGKLNADKFLLYGGIFADGDGTVEERTFQQKYVYRLKPLKNGTCEVILIYKDADSNEEAVKRKTIEVFVDERPTPPPVVPDPDVPVVPVVVVEIDKNLLASLKIAAAEDEKSFVTWKNASFPTVKEAYKGIAEAYTDFLGSIASGDPANAPTTWKDALTRMNERSVARSIPRLPALQKTRNALSDYIGAYEANTSFKSISADVTAKITKLSATLKEAAK